MLGRASSYLWGSSKKKENSPKSKTNPNQYNAHHASHSLTDLQDLSQFEDEKLQISKQPHSEKRPKHQIVSSSSALSNLAFHRYIPPQFKEDPVEVVLDKESGYKLSSSSSIRFLFPPSSGSTKHNRRGLCKYPFYICSNRNRLYVSKMDLMINCNKNKNTKHSINTDSPSPSPVTLKTVTIDDDGSIGGIGGVSLDNKHSTDFIEMKEAKTDDVTYSPYDLCSKLKSTSLDSSILSIINVDDLNRYLDSLKLTMEEKAGILKLCEWVKTEKLSIKLCEEMWMAEIVISYFASLSPTNPDLNGTWRRWISYRSDHLDDGLYNVNPKRLIEFFETGIFSIGFDKQRRPVWFCNTEGYDDSFGVEVITKACILWVTSLQWDLTKNEYDMFALRRGLSVC